MTRILQWPNHPILTTKAKPVFIWNAKLRAELDMMYEEMLASGGIGIAAPQVGISKTMALVQLGPDKPLYTLINPAITKQSKEVVDSVEGCLSLLGNLYWTTRSHRVKIKYFDREGNDQTLTAEGMLARAIQHEIDHLQGVLINHDGYF